MSCSIPSTGSSIDGDCDDFAADVNPTAAEDLDCVDTNCDGAVYPIGDGRDGTLVVSGTTTFSTASTSTTSSISVGQTQILVSNSAIFTAGDYVLFLDVYGSNAGQWSMEQVSSVQSGVLNLENGVDSNGSTSTTWAVRVPQYTDVTINGTLEAPGYSGSGTPGSGLIVFMASGTVNVQGSISASGKGYRGGTRTYSRTQTGQQGESYNGGQSRTTSANYSGGGGGYSPSLTHASGGGGGYASNGGSGTAVGGWGNTAGSAGSSVGLSDLSSMYFGGAGGSGSLDSDANGGSYGGAGGNGGGIILMSANDVVISGSINSSGSGGETGYHSGSAASPGGGGGGAGGSIVLFSNSISSSGAMVASGGGGGNGSEAGGSQITTGSGSNGRIRYFTTLGSVSCSPSAYQTCP